MVLRLLVDEMYEGLVPDLKKAGFEVESVKDLINRRKPLRSDYSVLTYAKDHELTLVTADIENQKGCQENGIKYVPINKETTLKSILEGLKSLEK